MDRQTAEEEEEEEEEEEGKNWTLYGARLRIVIMPQ